MAKSDKNTLKSWFQNGDYPNEDQFWSWMDSYWHKDEPIPIDIIEGLPALLAGKATQQDIDNLNLRIDELQASIGSGPTEVVYETDGVFLISDGKLLERVVIIPSADSDIGIGYAVGIDDIMPTMPLLADRAEVITLSIYAIGDTPIYFTGIVASTTIKLYTR